MSGSRARSSGWVEQPLLVHADFFPIMHHYLSPSSTAFKQMGHCCSSSGAQDTFSRGKEAINALEWECHEVFGWTIVLFQYFDVGGGGRSSNIPAKASWSQLPESTKNLDKNRCKRMLQATKKIHLYDNIQIFPSGALPWQVQVSPHFTIPCMLSPIFLSFSFLLFCPHLLLYSLLNILSLPLLQHSFIFSNLANWRSSSGAVPSAKGVQLCSSK